MGNLSSNILDIYNYHPAYKNLYKIEILPSTSEDAIEDIKTYISLHATSVSFNGESLSLERNDVTKNFQLSASNTYQRTNELTITWRENENWKVKQYHDVWLSCFYDRKHDCFISYPIDGKSVAISSYDSNLIYYYVNRYNLYRKIRVTLPDYSGKDTVLIEFKDVLPKTTGNIELEWGSSSNIVTHSITYYVRDWDIINK